MDIAQAENVQKQLDAEDMRLRAARVERLYDEETALKMKIEEAKKTIRDCKSRLTQNEWFIREQLRIMTGKQAADDSLAMSR